MLSMKLSSCVCGSSDFRFSNLMFEENSHILEIPLKTETAICGAFINLSGVCTVTSRFYNQLDSSSIIQVFRKDHDEYFSSLYHEGGV